MSEEKEDKVRMALLMGSPKLLSDAILEDYAAFVNKMDGTPKEDVIKRIMLSYNNKMEDAKKRLNANL